jgi:flavorubredoxin
MSETRRIGQLIAEGMRFEGVDVTMFTVSDYERQKIDPRDYDAIVLGSPTYHGQMMESMKTLLFALDKAGLEGKAGGAFGAYGWSGEAAERIFATMSNIFGMELVRGPLMLKSASAGGAMKMAQDYGREIARSIQPAEAAQTTREARETE